MIFLFKLSHQLYSITRAIVMKNLTLFAQIVFKRFFPLYVFYLLIVLTEDIMVKIDFGYGIKFGAFVIVWNLHI